MSFSNGILNLTNWVGNVILPTLAGSFLRHRGRALLKGRGSPTAMYGGLSA